MNYVGIDLHKKTITIHVVNQERKKVGAKRGRESFRLQFRNGEPNGGSLAAAIAVKRLPTPLSQFSWDDANRLIGETWYDSGKNVVNEVEYDYDLADRLTLAADDVASNEMTYWLDGNLKTQTTTESTTTLDMELTYYYGSEQNHYTPVLTSITDDYSGGVTYETTEAGRLTGAILHVGYDDVAEAQLTYTAQGWLETVTLTDEDLLGQIITTYDHDDAGRVKSITHEHDDFTTVSSLAEFEYVWDDGNRIESYTGPEGDREYVYDKTNQLLEVAEPGVGVLEEFDFDANGNRISTGYVPGIGNRLEEDGTFEYVYDNEGNTLAKTDMTTGDVTAYTWDNRNRLTAVETRDDMDNLLFREEYTYDVFNRRIRVATDTDGDEDFDTDRWTAYDGNNAHADFDGNGDMTTRYLNGRAMDQRFARYDVDAEETAFYLTDVINSVRLVADAEGNVLCEADYSAFGLIVSQSGTGDRFTYTGRELDATGDYYYRARYYGAGVGRFLSEDPIGFAAGDPNLYRYVGNNSINSIDPSGNVGIIVAGGIAIIVILVGGGNANVEIATGAGLIVGRWAFQVICDCIPRGNPSTTWQQLTAAERRIAGEVVNGRIGRGAFDRLPEHVKKAIIDNYKYWAKNAQGIRCKEARQLNQRRVDFLEGRLQDPPGPLPPPSK